MNKSKKTIKGTQKVSKKQFSINPKVWIVLTAILGLFLIVAILFDQLYKRPLVTIDDKKYYLEDLTYYFYNTESTYDYINQLYGGSYWDMPHGDSSNMTVRDYAKLETLNTVIYEEILYNEAIAKGYTLTEEEADKIDSDIVDILYNQGLSANLIKKNGFTPEYLTEVLTKRALAERYKQDLIDSFDIDDQAIKAEYNYDDYRQYDIEYLYISTKVWSDEEGTMIPLSDEEKKAALDKITASREEALEAEEWSAIIPEKEEELQYRESNFLPNDTYFSEDFMNTLKALDNKEITEVMEDENGYYVFRMVNNNSSETYDRTVNDAIKKVEEETFSEEYTNNILPNHSFKLHNNAIRNLRMGRITLVD